MPLIALIVDDEPLAREGLRSLLGEDGEFEEIHEARNGREAIEAIRTLRPDLVLLDVQMPDGDGLSVIREIGPDRMPAVVFVTAHDQYAIQAFEINAIDYLLKPVTAARFRQTLQRSKTHLRSRSAGDANRQILQLLETIAAPPRYIKRMAVRSAGKTVFVDAEEIDWIEAAENYVQLHTARAAHMLHVAMNTLEKSLDPAVFLRIHRRIIVNTGRIKELQPATHGEFVVILYNGIRLQSSRMYNTKLKALMTNPF
jgi:two-component system, LytTR family, response regulator